MTMITTTSGVEVSGREEVDTGITEVVITEEITMIVVSTDVTEEGSADVMVDTGITDTDATDTGGILTEVTDLDTGCMVHGTGTRVDTDIDTADSRRGTLLDLDRDGTDFSVSFSASIIMKQSVSSFHILNKSHDCWFKVEE